MNNDALEKSKQHFDATAKEYDASSDGKFTQRMYAPLLDKLRQLASGKLLDVGCGNGNVLAALSDTNLELYGIDLSEDMIEEAKKRMGDRAELCAANAEKLPFADGFFDVLVCNASFHHYPQPDTVLAEMQRVLKPGALLYIGESQVAQPGRFFLNIFIRFSPDGDFHIYGKKELTELLERHGFKLREVQRTSEHAVLYVSEKSKV